MTRTNYVPATFEKLTSSKNHSSPSHTLPATYSPLKCMFVPEEHSTHACVNFSCLLFAAALSPVFCTEIRPIGTALLVRITVVWRLCNSAETVQSGDRTTVMMLRYYQSSQRINSVAREVIIIARHTRTRLRWPER